MDRSTRRVLTFALVLVAGVAGLAGRDGRLAADGIRAVGGLALLLAAVWMWWRERAARGPLQRMAAAQGWTYARRAPVGLLDFSSAPFGVGHDRQTSNVVEGTAHGRHMVAFDYTYDSGNGRSSERLYYAVVALDMTCGLPELYVDGSALGRVEAAVGLPHVELESEDFNRHYRVSCKDPKLASDIVTPRTMELLLARHPITFRLGRDGKAVVYAPGRLDALHLLAWVSTIAGVLDLVPSFVWQDHGGLTQPLPSSNLEAAPPSSPTTEPS